MSLWRSSGLILSLIGVVLLASCKDRTDPTLHWTMGSFPSEDGVPIAYQTAGGGPVSLVFVHGWICDRRYWREQLDHFAAAHTVVAVDLAGHGESGSGREEWTMDAFGKDVAAVVKGLGLDRVLLVGHSMGALVIAEAARLIPDRVIGLVAADAFTDLGPSVRAEQVEGILRPFREDYEATVREMISGNMFVSSSDPALREWIVNDMSSSPSQVGIGAVEHYLGWFGEHATQVFEELRVPVRAINSDMNPTNQEAAERHGLEIVLMSEVGHFLMMEDPETFNSLLAEAVADFQSES